MTFFPPEAMNSADDVENRLEELLKCKQAAEHRVQEMDGRLENLAIHKWALVSCLTSGEQSDECPFPIPASGKGAIRSRDITLIYVLNLGISASSNASDPFSTVRCPNGYRVIRKFVKHRNSRSPHGEIFYTTTAMLRKKGWYYVIKDDENNICNGYGAFGEFRKWFDDPLPFRSVEEWLGLYSHEIWSRIAAVHGPVEQEEPSNGLNLLQYFTGQK